MAEDINNMNGQQVSPEEGEAKKILEEDPDDTVDTNEITRIIRLYLGREADETELARFNNMKESELKILTDYLLQKREEAKMNQETNKVKNGLALKTMKTVGENNIAAMKNSPGTPPMPISTPPGMPPAGMPTQGQMPPPPENKNLPDGRFTLVKFPPQGMPQ